MGYIVRAISEASPRKSLSKFGHWGFALLLIPVPSIPAPQCTLVSSTGVQGLLQVMRIAHHVSISVAFEGYCLAILH
jgi:hypothetical protein